jgi:hypothetical protein
MEIWASLATTATLRRLFRDNRVFFQRHALPSQVLGASPSNNFHKKPLAVARVGHSFTQIIYFSGVPHERPAFTITSEWFLNV